MRRVDHAPHGYGEAEDRGREGHLQLILDHGCEARELLFLVMAVDGGFGDHRVKLCLIRPCHAGQRTKREDRTETKSRN